MLELYDIVKGEPQIKISSLVIPEIKKIWNSDKTKGKITATSKLNFLYHYTDRKSPYASLPDAERRIQCKNAFLPDTDIDLDLENAIDAIKSARSAIETLHEASKNAMFKISRYLDETEANNDTISKMVAAMQKIPSLIEVNNKTTKALEEEVTKSGKKMGYQSDILTEQAFDDDEW